MQTKIIKQIHTKKSPKNHITTPTAKKYDRTLPSNAFWPLFGCGKSAEYWGLRFSLDKKNTLKNEKNKCSPTPSIKMIKARVVDVVDLAPIFRSIGTICGFACFRTCFYRGQISNMAVSTSLTTQGHFGKQNWRVREHKLQRYKHIDMRWTIPTWWLSHATRRDRSRGFFGKWMEWMKGVVFGQRKKKTTTHEKTIKCETRGLQIKLCQLRS